MKGMMTFTSNTLPCNLLRFTIHIPFLTLLQYNTFNQILMLRKKPFKDPQQSTMLIGIFWAAIYMSPEILRNRLCGVSAGVDPDLRILRQDQKSVKTAGYRSAQYPACL